MDSILPMADNWQPTVLRIVPFSSNNARNLEIKTTVKRPHEFRGFPLCSVTGRENVRSKTSAANAKIRSQAKSVNFVRSDVNEELDASSVKSDATQYGYTTITECEKNDILTKVHRQNPKMKATEMHSEMKELLKLRLYNMKDQLSSIENKGDNKEEIARVENTLTKRSKPSYGTSPDSRTQWSQVNERPGSVTPSELELHRMCDSYYFEQVHSRNRFKLNVNQLPRDETPINDHDPDKLNMKQVIAFLKTETSKNIQKRKVYSRDSVKPLSRTNYDIKHSDRPYMQTLERMRPTPECVSVMWDNVKSLSRSNLDIKQTVKPNMQAIEQMRRTPGCVSVTSVKSTPNMPYKERHKDQALKTHSSMSMRSMKEKRSRDSHSEIQKHIKEFKLFRFLAMTPDEALQNTSSDRGVTPNAFDKLCIKNEAQSPRCSTSKSLRKMFSGGFRKSSTAHVLHRHVLNRATMTPIIVNEKRVTINSNNHFEQVKTYKAIRLPVAFDVGLDSSEDETCSTTSSSF
ncbi:uncharacterized protein LOC127853360 [Dreissena polymorpha]|uniref:Uncharacterized protein n=1 Tax=Dreissena polymorpha TaxID=45954 RepID=A0A9D4HN14_DREPO|nr:uncharacterized protein LOC127853360 [Dreissena polymorpha]KAH3725319.1 hypothetical protein DPMN_051153 [Dreissena polymorpha]